MTLAKRKEVRQRDVYIRRKARGPGSPKTVGEALVDEHLREAALDFDLSPILSGDAMFAERVADDFIAEVRRRADADPDVTDADLGERLDVLWPFLYRSLNRFRDRLKTGAKGVIALKSKAAPVQAPPVSRVAAPPVERPSGQPPPRGLGSAPDQPKRQLGSVPDQPKRRLGQAKKIVKRALGSVEPRPKRRLGDPK